MTFKSRMAAVGLLFLMGCTSPSVKPPTPAPADPVAAAEWVRQGQLALEQGSKLAAIRAWREAVRLDPGNPVVVNNLAVLLIEQNQFADAATVLEQGVEFTPTVAELHYNLAVVSELYLLDLGKALSHYHRYRALTPADDEAVAGWIADLERRLD